MNEINISLTEFQAILVFNTLKEKARNIENRLNNSDDEFIINIYKRQLEKVNNAIARIESQLIDDEFVNGWNCDFKQEYNCVWVNEGEE